MRIDMEKAIKRWEKSFKKKMKYDEKVMFRWGYAYAIKDVLPIDKIRILKERLDKRFLGKRKGKAQDYLFCKKGIIPYSEIKELKKEINEIFGSFE